MNIYFRTIDEAYTEFDSIIKQYEKEQKFEYTNVKIIPNVMSLIVPFINCVRGFLIIQQPDLTFYITLVTDDQVRDNQALLLPVVFDRESNVLKVVPLNPYNHFIPIFNQGIDDDSLYKRSFEFNGENENKGYKIIYVWENTTEEIICIDDPNTSSKQNNDELFILPEMELIYLLINCDSSELHRNPKIGITRFLYYSSRLAREWKEKMINNVNRCQTLSYGIRQKVIEKVEKLYHQIVGDAIPEGFNNKAEFIIQMCDKYDGKELLNSLEWDDDTIDIYKDDPELLTNWINSVTIDLNEENITKEKQQFCLNKIDKALVAVGLLEII